MIAQLAFEMGVAPGALIAEPELLEALARIHNHRASQARLDAARREAGW